MWQNFFSQILQQSFESAKVEQEGLSMRGFARQLGISPGLASELLRNERRISKDRALAIAASARLPNEVIDRLQKMMGSEENSPANSSLSEVALSLIMDPNYYRILCALEVLSVPASFETLSNFLDLPLVTVQALTKSLNSLEVLKIEGDGIYWSGQYPSTTQDIPSPRIAQFHRDNLSDVVQSLELPVSEREFTTITFAGSENLMPEAKQQIRSLRDTLSDTMRKAKPDRVYQLSIQLRPVSKSLKESGYVTN